MRSFYTFFLIFLGLLWGTAWAQSTPQGPRLFPDLAGNIGGMDQAANGGFYLIANGSSTTVTLIRALTDRSTLNTWRISAPVGIQATDVVALPNGAAILGTTSTNNMVLMRVDSSGNRLWAKTYPIGNLLITNTVSVNDQGEFLISCFMAIGGSLGPTLIKTDASGDILWTRRIPGDNAYQIRSANYCSDGSVLVTGGLAGDLYYAKLDDSGNTLWARRYPASGADAGLFIRELSNGDIGIASYNFTANRYGYLTRTDPLGNVLWSKSAHGINEYYLNVVETPNGHLQVSGDETIATSQTAVFVADFEADGNYTGAVKLSTSTSRSSYQGRGKSHIVDRSGNVHVMGTGYSAQNVPRPYWSTIAADFSNPNCDQSALSLIVSTVTVVGQSIPDPFVSVNLTTSDLNATVETIGLCTSQSCNGTPQQIRFLGQDRAFCSGTGFTTLLDASAYTGSYQWSTGATTSSIQVTTPGTYSVSVSSACGVLRDTIEIREYAAPPRPTLSPASTVQICQGSTFWLKAGNRQPGSTLRWSTGSSADSISIGQAGTYSVTAISSNGCRATSLPVVVTVALPPVIPVVTAPRLGFCPGGTVRLHIQGGPRGNRVIWNTAIQDTILNVSLAGSYFATLVNAAGCSTVSAPVQIAAYAAPPTPGILARGETAFCFGGEVRLTASNVSQGDTLRWSTGMSDTTIRVRSTGSYSLTVTNSNGCSKTSNPIGVTVWALPVAPVLQAQGPISFCADSSLTIQASAGLTDTLRWTNGVTGPRITVNSSGSYGLTITDIHGCKDTAAPVAVTVRPLPPIPQIQSAGPTNFCSGANVVLHARNIQSGNALRWSAGGTDTMLTVNSSGSYSVTTITPYGCRSSSLPIAVTVRPTPPIPVISHGSLSFCAGDSVRLRVPGLLPSDTLRWTTGQLDTAINATASGSYGATVTNAARCSATAAPVTVVVNRQPVVPVLVPRTPLSVCQGDSVRLRATGIAGGDQIRWPNGTTDSVLVMASSATGIYFTVSTPQGCRAASNVVNVTVRPKPPIPTITALSPTTFCEGDSVRLVVRGLAPTDSVRWSSGSRDTTVVIRTSSIVGLVVTNNAACSTPSANVTVTVNRQPLAPTLQLLTLGPLCAEPGAEMELGNIHAPDQVRWTTGDTMRRLRVNMAGTYHASITTAEGCRAVSDSVVIHPNPAAAAIRTVGATTFCQPGRVRLELAQIGVGDRWQWLPGGPADSLGIWVDTSGSFQIESVNDFGCRTRSAPVQVQVLPIARVRIDSGGPLHFCSPGQVRLRLRGVLTGSSIRWNSGSTDSTVNINTTIPVSAIIQNPNGCPSFSDTVSVTAWPTPPRPGIQANAPARLCFGERLDLTATGLIPGLRLFWSSGEADSTRIRIDTTGAYTLTVVNAFGCSSVSDTTRIRFYDPTRPTLIVRATNQIPCTGDSVLLVADGPDPIRWNTGYVGRQITVRNNGQYIAQAGGVNTCLLPVSDTARVVINPRPQLLVRSDTALCDGDAIILAQGAPQTGVEYLWTPTTLLSSASEYAPVLKAVNKDLDGTLLRTRYRLEARYTTTGCSTADSVEIAIHSHYELGTDGLPYCLQGPILVPNVVTPNNDGDNDTFTIRALGYVSESTLEVFNRYGVSVYKASPYGNDWDAASLPSGTYYYRLQVPKLGWDLRGWVEVVK